MNGSGKTSLIHAILIALESSVGSSGNIVRLNGPFGLELGTAADVRNWVSVGPIEVDIKTQSRKYSWVFSVASDDSLNLSVIQRPEETPKAFSGLPRAFSYLSAERLGPRSTMDTSALPSEAVEVGTQGENCAHIIDSLGAKSIEAKERLHPNRAQGASELLKYEVEHRLTEIVKPVEIDAQRYPGSAITRLRFRSPGGEWVSPPNMGFGVSFALPIILAGLIARRGGLLVVESPEAHLHPAGQSRMGVFLAWLAGRGVQVLLETHSDHVLNGVRRAIGEYKYVGNKSAIVLFFGSSEEDALCVSELEFAPFGGIHHWPSGFFDQYQLDVASLGRIRRRS